MQPAISKRDYSLGVDGKSQKTINLSQNKKLDKKSGLQN